MVAAGAESLNELAGNLYAERADKDESGDHFARAARRQPSLDPGVDHARKEDIAECVEEEHCCGPWKELRRSDGNAQAHCEEASDASKCRRVQQPEGEPHQQVVTITNGKACERIQVKGWTGCRRADADQLP